MKPILQQCGFAAALPHLILIGFVVSLLRDWGLPAPQTIYSPYAGLSLVEGLAILLVPLLGWVWLAAIVGCISLAGGLLGFYFHKAT